MSIDLIELLFLLIIIAIIIKTIFNEVNTRKGNTMVN